MPTAITIITTTNKPVMVLGTDTDPLVMLVALSAPILNTGIYMLCQCNPMAIYSTHQIQTLMGCDTISAPCMRRKKKVVAGRRRLWRLWKLETTTTWKPNSAASQYHAFHTVQQWLCNEILAYAWCWQGRGGWLVPAETDNPVAPDNLCNAGAKLHVAEHVAEHVDASRQD